MRQQIQKVRGADAAAVEIAGARAAPVSKQGQEVEDADLPVTVGAVPGAQRPEDHVALACTAVAARVGAAWAHDEIGQAVAVDIPGTGDAPPTTRAR